MAEKKPRKKWYKAKGRKPTIRSAKQLAASDKVTPRQSKFVKAFVKTRNARQSALIAGYSPKDPDSAGQNVLQALRLKAPEVMARLGLTMGAVIQKHLVPLMHATETKFAQYEGEFTDSVDLEDNGIRLGATRTALQLLNAFPEKDMEKAAQYGVRAIVVDIPRPDRSMYDVQPIVGQERLLPKQKAAAPGTNGANGAKKNGNKKPDDEDPRPKQ